MNVRRAIAIGVLFGALIVGVFFATGCENRAIGVQPTSNGNVKLELLFEHDGCKVYRFMDFGEPVYYADCRGSGSTTTSMKWDHIEGKVAHNFQSTTVQ